MTQMRHEDLRLITGAGRFTADWNLENQCHMAVVRSPHAHAKLLQVDTSAAQHAAGVVMVVTAADVTAAHYASLPSGPEITGVQGAVIRKGVMPVLAIDRVRFSGQPVAVVIAETALQAQDACELVNVTYETLPAVVDVHKATDPLAQSIHPGVENNRSLIFESGDRKAV
ncbi:MAG: xanthine dehydrogenase family protein molybdopterin-binding subunit, partial [Pseudomonadota bacterium]